MKKNMGQVDRWIRIGLGVILLLLVVLVQANWRWLGLVGIIPLATGLMNSCPLYSLLGISTNKGKDGTKAAK
jgi:hypothetical protein